MTITLSWDLFVLVFFVVIVAYSFIVGRDSTLKIILGTYVSMIAADAGGTIFSQYLSGSVMFTNLLKFAAVGNEQEAMVLVKVVIFIAFVIIFAVKGAFEVDTVDDRSVSVRFVLSVVYAIMSAGLIVSAVLVFVSGISFIGLGEPKTTVTALWDVYNESALIRSIINNSALWFSLPALAFLVHSLYTKRE